MAAPPTPFLFDDANPCPDLRSVRVFAGLTVVQARTHARIVRCASCGVWTVPPVEPGPVEPLVVCPTCAWLLT